MSRNRPKRRGRANICWGLEFGDEQVDQTIEWPDREPDLYIFPCPSVGSEGCRDHLLRHCEEGLAAHVHVLWKQATDPVTRQGIASRLTVMPISDALDRGAAARDDWFAASSLEALFSWFSPDRMRPANGDLDGIQVLDSAVKTLKNGEDIAFDPLALTKIAFHASFNPVALCPPAFALGELLTVAAWTGMLSRGRTVVMPRFVASYWLMLLDEANDHPPSWDPDAFLIQKAASIVGLDLIRKTCNAVNQTGPARIRRQSLRRSSMVQNDGFEIPAKGIQFQATCSEAFLTRSVPSNRL